MLHIHNEDAYNILNDKTIQLHKMSKRKNEWIYDLAFNPNNPHEKRFEPLPYNGMPEVNSKIKKPFMLVNIKNNKGRSLPIIDLIDNEAIQPRKDRIDLEYNYNTENQISQNKFLNFSQMKRFDNNGIFGDLFDEKKKRKFGQPDKSSIDIDRAEKAINVFTKPKL